MRLKRPTGSRLLRPDRGLPADFRASFVTTAVVVCMIWLCATALAAGEKIVSNYSDVFGNLQHPFSLEGKAGSVLIFYWHDCPICNSYAPKINRLRAHFPRFAFYLIEVDPDWSAAEARAHVQEFHLEAPLLLDRDHHLVDVAKATVTPEAVVFGKNETVLYRGRIDNAYASLGLRRPAATTHDLRDALESILAGKPVTFQPPAVGCLIPH